MRSLHPRPAPGALAAREPIAKVEAEAGLQPKRRRIRGSTSRSGCQTCKARRVKCDEGLPTCGRCKKAKLECEGYAQRSSHPRTSRKIGASRALAPRPAASAPVESFSPPLKELCVLQQASSQLPRTLTGLPIIEGIDVMYFDLFRHRVAPELAAGYYHELWSTAISEGLQDGCVRDSIIAIGALAQAMSSVRDHQTFAHPVSWSHKHPVNEHHRTSLVHHLRAVTGFRAFIGNSQVLTLPRKVFIMTLLLIVYELLQGHIGGVDSILDCGMAVLRNSITLFHNTQAAKADIGDIEHALPRLAVMGLFTHQLHSRRAFLHHLRVQPEFKFPKPGVDPVAKVFAYWGRFYTLAVTSLCQTAHDGRCTTFNTNARQANFLRALRDWKPVLERYLNQSDSSPEEKRALRLTMLHWDVVWISFSCSLDPTGLAFDTFTVQFRHLFCHSVQFIQEELASETPRLMMFGEGILMPLFFIVTCCRDHDLRMAAAAVAYRLPWKESTWDNRFVLLAHLGSVMMEENGRDADGWIPPASRWHWRGGQTKSGGNDMTSTYLRHVPDKNGEPVIRTLIINLDQWPEICSMVGCLKDHSEFHTLGDLDQTLIGNRRIIS
ncbi:hypothetical protein EDB81DRAFT_653517 [Dactylonectria macrodidyma]|uniref:Zn(2)-C6 fungal-type domain-containing protein n=1 Tax=Dactylonectria macrodidyma TaxID=307937 RepID=A0A9P9IZS8_9HYPO|nr:hypothetical protein EDB81DRAFT_653517 [Dactylonectria macrodidyma]